MPDLLPDNFGTETATPPVAILREQAEHLTKRTSGLVLGRVSTTQKGGKLVQRFILEVPSLDDYAYELFTVQHSILLYPAELRHAVTAITTNTSCDNQEEFQKALQEFFALPEVGKIVTALKAQAVPAGATG
jgi:hypothetical protein